MDYELISRTALFQGCSPTATENLLYGLKTFTKKYKKFALFSFLADKTAK